MKAALTARRPLLTAHFWRIDVSNQTDAHGREEEPLVPRCRQGEAVEARRRLRRERRILQPDARARGGSPQDGSRQLLDSARRAADRHRPPTHTPAVEGGGGGGAARVVVQF